MLIAMVLWMVIESSAFVCPLEFFVCCCLRDEETSKTPNPILFLIYRARPRVVDVSGKARTYFESNKFRVENSKINH